MLVLVIGRLAQLAKSKLLRKPFAKPDQHRGVDAVVFERLPKHLV
jgi:hypothetical protein